MTQYRLKKLFNGNYIIQRKGWFFWNDCCVTQYDLDEQPIQYSYYVAKEILEEMMKREAFEKNPTYIYPPLPDKEP